MHKLAGDMEAAATAARAEEAQAARQAQAERAASLQRQRQEQRAAAAAAPAAAPRVATAGGAPKEDEGPECVASSRCKLGCRSIGEHMERTKK